MWEVTTSFPPGLLRSRSKCSKKGHYSTVCCTAGLIWRIQSSPIEEDDDEFLGAIETEPSQSRSWTVPLLLNDIGVEFKIDTGVDVTVIPETIFKQLKSTVLKSSVCSLSGQCHDNLKVCGQFQGTLKYGPHNVH